jgi:hypothetical protein
LSVLARKILGVVVATAVLGVLIGLYISQWAKAGPPTITPPTLTTPVGSVAALTLQTDAAVGKKLSPSHPDWVSYLVRTNGKWVRSTVYKVPANSLVQVTIYQFDTPTGLRNPFLSQVQGTIGGTMTLDGKTMNSIEAEEASHTFAIPSLGVFVPLAGVNEEAKNQCEEGPCELSQAHRTITFTFRTRGKGKFRWQCFVPCAAGTFFGNGGPMQTFGYMGGFIEVV